MQLFLVPTHPTVARSAGTTGEKSDFVLLINSTFIFSCFKGEQSPHFLIQSLSSKRKIVSFDLGEVGSYSGSCGFYGLCNPHVFLRSQGRMISFNSFVRNPTNTETELRVLSFVSLLCNHFFINFSE